MLQPGCLREAADLQISNDMHVNAVHVRDVGALNLLRGVEALAIELQE